jgi:RNA polymerase sigma-70 factor (ECF subfamily)
MMRNRGRRESLDETVAVQAENFDRQEQIELFSSVMSLPEKYRTVLYLFYYEDYSVKEIAEILHIKSSAVTTRLSRARNILKIQLTEGDTYEL